MNNAKPPQPGTEPNAAAADSILEKLSELLASEFDIEPGLIKPDANLFDDLDIDSIDAIDMLARLRQLTGKDLPADELKSVQTISDIVALVDAH